MELNDLTIVYCKNCRSYRETNLNKDATLYQCTKDSNKFNLEEPNLYLHKKCFRNKKNKKD